MGRLWNSAFLVGIALLAMVCMILFSEIGSVTTKDVFSVGREIDGADLSKILVSLKISVNTQEHLDSFPKDIERWESVNDYSDTSLKTSLSADSYILRNYQVKQQLIPSFFLLILHSQLPDSFHNPSVCYRSQGYTIGQLSKDYIAVKGIPGIVNIPVSRLEIYRGNSDGKVTARMLVFYTYLRDVKFNSGEITILRVSTPVASFEDAKFEQSLKEFMGCTFEEVLGSFAGNSQKLIMYVSGLGLRGYLILTLVFLVPLAMVFYPLLTGKLFLKVKMGNQGTQDMETIQSDPNTALLPKTDNGAVFDPILSDIKNSRSAQNVYNIVLSEVEKSSGLNVGKYDTLRQFYNKVSPVLNTEVAGDFERLTALVEKAIYSETVDSEQTALAMELGENIIGNLHQIN